MNVLTELYEKTDSPEAYVTGFCDHMANVVNSLDKAAIAELIDIVEKVATEEKTLFLVANGGSAAVSGHWVNDLSANAVVEGQPGYRVISLTDNASSLTALGNDVGFDLVFVNQLKANMRKDDVVIFMSVSGNSPNLVKAAEYAKDNGGIVVSCTGMEGGKLKDICDLSIHTPSTKDEYGPIEDVFSIIMHIVTGYLTMKRGKKLSH